jgi:hypothetical protein
MENRLNGLKNYLNEISAHKAQGGVVSSIGVQGMFCTTMECELSLDAVRFQGLSRRFA